MQVSVDGALATARQLAIVPSNPNLFADRAPSPSECIGVTQGLVLLATNADGSRNTCSTRSKLGSVVSVYLHGVGLGDPVAAAFQALAGSQSVTVVGVSTLDEFITRVDVQLPQSFTGASALWGQGTVGGFAFALRQNSMPVGPLTPPPTGNIVDVAGARLVWAEK